MRTKLLVFFPLFLLVSACTSASPSDGMEVSKAEVVLPASASMGGMDTMDPNTSLAGYFRIENKTTVDDRLLQVTCDFAESMLHETKMEGDVANMRELAFVDVPAGAVVEFKTGGMHVMFVNVNRDLKVGDTVQLNLVFEHAGSVTVTATVMGH